MLSTLIFIMIFVGVTISVYQIYDLHYTLNFGAKERNPRGDNKELRDLSLIAKESSKTEASPDLIQAVKNVFGCDLDHRIILAAFSEGKEKTYAGPLLRRKRNIGCNGKIKILHLPFFKTSPPTKNIRGLLLKIVFINCLLAIFFGGLSVYTTAYEVSTDHISWINNELILMLIIFLLVLITHIVSKLDIYMHDIYIIGKLND